ncbi:MAG: DUF6644 family protein [Vicinamibacterales bacterium]
MSRAALLPLFQWCDHTAIAIAIRESTWLFPFIQVFHLLGLTLLLGTTVVVDLRLMGCGLRRQPISRLALNLWPWMQRSLAVILGSGILLFVSEAMKCYGNDAFWFKMGALTLALAFHFTVFRATITADDTQVTPLRSRAAGVVSLLLWLSVGAGGAAIGFV